MHLILKDGCESLHANEHFHPFFHSRLKQGGEIVLFMEVKVLVILYKETKGAALSLQV